MANHYCGRLHGAIYMDWEGMTLVQVLLISLIATPFIGVIVLMLLQRSSLRIVRRLTISILTLPIFMILILIYEISHTNSDKLLTIMLNTLPLLSNQHDTIRITLALAIDAISLWLMLFTSIIIALTACAGVYIKKRQRLFYGLIIFMESLLFTLFMARDGLLLISVIAIIAIIMFFLIGIWGQDGSAMVARKFVTWQLAACVLLIMSSLLLIALHTNGNNNGFQLPLTDEASYMMQDHLFDEQPDQQQLRQAAFVLFMLAILCMLPMFGTYYRLVELIKKSHMVVVMLYCGTISIIGWYVLYRIGSIYYFDLLASIRDGLLWILSMQFLVASILLWKQQQLRGWLAYGVWGQLSLIGILMLTLSEQGLTISLVHLLSFVATSSLLCFLLAAIIERTRTDQIKSLRGILSNMPFLGGSVVAAIFAWLGIPALSQFLGTAHAVILTFPTSRWISIFITFGIICNILVAIRLLYKLQRGRDELANRPNELIKDMRFTEAIPNIVLLSMIILLGCYPIVVVDMLELPLHMVYSIWSDIPVVDQWDIGAISSIWTTSGGRSSIVIVIALLMMLAIGIVNRKNNQVRAIIYWQALFQLLALVVIVASSYETGNIINGRDLLLYVVVYIMLLIATLLAAGSNSKQQQMNMISGWNGLYYRDPRLAIMMLWLIVHWLALPFTSPFQVKLNMMGVWIERGNFGLLTIWALLHLLMMKKWLEWLYAIYVVSDTTAHAGLQFSSELNGMISRNARIILWSGCLVLIGLSFIV